jgi:AcrR family transcriptional regulator
MTQQVTKQHILESTITAIEQHGVSHLTTRVIAAQAGVNNAALHYYYGTKDRLISEALALTAHHMLEDTEEILARQESIQDRLRALFEYLVDGTRRFPNVIRAHLTGPLMEGDSDTPFTRMVETWLDRTSAELWQALPRMTEARARISLHACLSAILVAGLMPASLRHHKELDLRREAFRKRFIDQLLDLVFNRPERPEALRPRVTGER